MTFFTRSIEQITYDDLAELLAANAVENIRLEFKREAPGPDELLKKITSFANSYGGYLIVGAEAGSADGRLSGLPGVAPIAGYKQATIQRCYDGSWPPVNVMVSDPIPVPDSTNVCYALFTPLSLDAPHFLPRRRGLWIRTDEFSQNFEARLATMPEVVSLANRRNLVISRRTALIDRSKSRFESLVQARYESDERTPGLIGATLYLTVGPELPSEPLLAESGLRQLLYDSRIDWRQVGFPMVREIVTQQESVLSVHAAGSFSLHELNVWGYVFNAVEIERLAGSERKVGGIHLGSLIGYILVYLEQARTVYQKVGYNGPILIHAHLARIRGKPFLYFPYGEIPEVGPSSPFDDEITIQLSISPDRLQSHRNEVASDVLRLLFFAMNWEDHSGDQGIEAALRRGLEYNLWQ